MNDRSVDWYEDDWNTVVTDFQEIWKLGLDAAEPEADPVDELVVTRQQVERVETTVVVERRLGQRVWFEERPSVVYRAVIR